MKRRIILGEEDIQQIEYLLDKLEDYPKSAAVTTIIDNIRTSLKL